ncbi:MAG: bifunctional enoyl-CoA hydratase/phosphate acetyltransferase [Prevotellaceae bacterium]|jgi:phosphate butyryltransferase|nr:bifunctional enoyl-CoA hydratase/phosphate acetyltransferase [Prevotellaceae bacterium]
MITKLEQLVEKVKARGKKKLVAAFANDSHTIGAVSMAIDRGLIEGILVGDETSIKAVCAEEKIEVKKFTIVQEADEAKAAAKAVEMVRNGEAAVLMKGLVSTDKYMRAILNKETGLLPPKATLSHVCVLEVPTYHKLLTISDIAVIPAPEFGQKVTMTNNVINVAKLLDIEKPKVAIIAATEQVLTGMQACVDAAVISKMADRGQIRGAQIDGPLAVDVALDQEAVEIKKLKSPVAGDADCMVFPNIESANAFFKAATKLTKAELAGIVVGAKAPCVLTSRGDTTMTKLYSIALGALMAK